MPTDSRKRYDSSRMSIDHAGINDPHLPAADLLTLLRIEDEKLLRVLHGLGIPEWAHDTNCPGWNVHYIAAHLARGAEFFMTAVENGLRGDYSTLSPEDRQARLESYVSQNDRRLLEALERNMDRFQQVLGGLKEDQLQTTGAHPMGRMTAHWFINQRLAEVAFHSWDIRTSLALGSDFDPGVATALLPLIVLDNLRFLVKSKEPFVAHLDRWTVALPDGSQTDAPADITITGRPASLCLLLYGRDRTLEGLQVEGNRELVGVLSGQ